MRYYRIKNWEQYQHYKDRDPVWIKLHRDLLSSRTWVALDDASRVLAVASMLLAAKTDNKIPADNAYIKRVAYLNSDPNFEHLQAVDFIELVDDASNTLASCYQPASNLLAQRREEKSRDREEERQSRGDEKSPPDFNFPTQDEVRNHGTNRLGLPQDACDDYWGYWQGRGWEMSPGVFMRDWRVHLAAQVPNLRRRMAAASGKNGKSEVPINRNKEGLKLKML